MKGVTRYPPQCGGVGTLLPSGHFSAAPLNLFSNSSRFASGADCCEAQAPICDDHGRDWKYASDSSAETLLAYP